MTEPHTPRPVIVVGIDGSPQSAKALAWAAQYASLVSGAVRAVIAWEQAPGFAYFPAGTEGLEREARHTVDRVVEQVLGETPTVDIERKVVRGNPTPVLVSESKGAQLLVVGDRGYGGFAGLLLGSVGEHCVRDAPCSVVVVRDAR